jgi:uncharacterized protein (DUF3084 family)
MLMDISLIPDTYTLGIDGLGNYTDIIPSIRQGIICPCAARKDKVYESVSKFGAHIKTKRHQKWVMDMNHNKANHYNELLQCKEVMEQQKKIIAHRDVEIIQRDAEISRKDRHVECLLNQLAERTSVVQEQVNLLDFD